MIFFVTALLVTNTLVASTHRLLFLNVVVFLFIFLLFFITLEILLLDHFLELLDLFTIQLDSHLLCYCNQIRRDLVFKTFHLIVIFLVIVLNSHFDCNLLTSHRLLDLSCRQRCLLFLALFRLHHGGLNHLLDRTCHVFDHVHVSSCDWS